MNSPHMLYRKRPIAVEAKRWDGDWIEMAAFFSSFGGQPVTLGHVYVRKGLLYIKTLEGVMRADEGYWVIHGIDGEFYPCKSSIFDKTYEIVADGR